MRNANELMEKSAEERSAFTEKAENWIMNRYPCYSGFFSNLCQRSSNKPGVLNCTSGTKPSIKRKDGDLTWLAKLLVS